MSARLASILSHLFLIARLAMRVRGIAPLILRVPQRHNVVDDSYREADGGQVGQQGVKANWFNHFRS